SRRAAATAVTPRPRPAAWFVCHPSHPNASLPSLLVLAQLEQLAPPLEGGEVAFGSGGAGRTYRPQPRRRVMQDLAHQRARQPIELLVRLGGGEGAGGGHLLGAE